MMKYPGLGLHLRYNNDGHPTTGFYPIGAHGSCGGAVSDPLTVREVAMMNIIERLTDKDEWYKKVFDESIVSKWHEEALAISDEDLWSLAIGGKHQDYNEDGSVILREHIGMQAVVPLSSILTEYTFSCVSSIFCTWLGTNPMS
jgi:hypothetical protein